MCLFTERVQQSTPKCTQWLPARTGMQSFEGHSDFLMFTSAGSWSQVNNWIRYSHVTCRCLSSQTQCPPAPWGVVHSVQNHHLLFTPTSHNHSEICLVTIPDGVCTIATGNFSNMDKLKANNLVRGSRSQKIMTEAVLRTYQGHLHILDLSGPSLVLTWLQFRVSSFWAVCLWRPHVPP